MVILRRPDLDMTDEEFKEYLDKSISDEDIKQMFDCLTPDYIMTGDELTDLLELYIGRSEKAWDFNPGMNQYR